MGKYKGIIFDLDGTLVDTLADIANSVNHILEQLALPTHSVESFRQKVGQGSRVMISRSLAEDKQHLLDTVLEKQLKYYAEHLCEHSRPYPGVPDMLAELKNARFKLAVLSNKTEPLTRKIIDTLFEADLFEMVYGQTDALPLKPDPAAAWTICKKMGVAIEQMVFVGDSAIDMQTARNAGMLAVGVSWGFRDRAELEKNGCHIFIEQAEELISLLQV